MTTHHETAAEYRLRKGIAAKDECEEIEDYQWQQVNELIKSPHIPTAIDAYLAVCGGELRHNNYLLLHEAAARIRELENDE